TSSPSACGSCASASRSGSRSRATSKASPKCPPPYATASTDATQPEAIPMNVTATAPVGQQASVETDTTNPAGSLDYDAFLRLLIAQMKNQDPTKPTDPSQFVAQLASFSSV